MPENPERDKGLKIVDERHGSDSNEESGEPKSRPQSGWAVPIPATTPRAYVGGDAALNVPKLAEDPDSGDWHEWGTWWSHTPAKADGTTLGVRLWGPDGETAGAPGPPELRDARAAMALIAHPSAENTEPVHAATVVQTVLDLAWDALTHGHEPPDRRATWRWLSDAGEAHARKRAGEVEAWIADEALRTRWWVWRQAALEGEDPFYDTGPRLPGPPKPTPQISIEIVAR